MQNSSAVKDGLAFAKQAADDARDAAVAGLTHIAADAEVAAPKVTKEAAADVIEFVPQQYRSFAGPFLNGLVSGALSKVAAEEASMIQKGLGFAVARIDALKF